MSQLPENRSLARPLIRYSVGFFLLVTKSNLTKIKEVCQVKRERTLRLYWKVSVEGAVQRATKLRRSQGSDT